MKDRFASVSCVKTLQNRSGPTLNTLAKHPKGTLACPKPGTVRERVRHPVVRTRCVVCAATCKLFLHILAALFAALENGLHTTYDVDVSRGQTLFVYVAAVFADT